MNIRDVIPIEEMERLLEAADRHFAIDGELAFNIYARPCVEGRMWLVNVNREEMIGPDRNWRREFTSELLPTLADAFAVAYSPENREKWRKGESCQT